MAAPIRHRRFRPCALAFFAGSMAVLLLCSAETPSGAAVDAQSEPPATPAGRWQGKADTPDGPIAFTMSLAVDGDAVTGEITLPEGAIKIENGRWAGGELSFTIVHPNGDTITARAKLQGDVLAGEWSGTQGGSGAWEARREPAQR